MRVFISKNIMRIHLSDHFNYRRLLRFTLPSIIMMIFTSIYSVIDGFFVSNFAGKNPFTAVNLIMPILMILGTFGFMFGTGGTALVSKTYGQGDKEKANSYFSLIVYFTFGLSIVIALISFFAIRPIAIALGASGELLENCVIYARIIIIALPFFALQVMFHSFFVAAEKPRLNLFVTLLSGFTNIILDALLVILLPFEYKLIGAAIATAVAQSVGGLIPVIYFLKKNDSILRLGKTKFDFRAIRKAALNGLSEFMSNISFSLVGILYNLQLMKYIGEDGVAAYGVMMYVSMIFMSAMIGYTIGMAPLVGYNHGAKNYPELQGLLKKSLLIISIAGLSMSLLAEVLSIPICKMFVSYDQNLYCLTLKGFRIFAICFIFIGYGIFTSGFFTALNDGLTSGLIAFLRTLVFQSFAVMLMPLIWGVDGIWWSCTISEFLSLILGGFFLIIKRKKYNYY